MVLPSSDVTNVVMRLLLPTFKAMEPLAVPDATGVSLTVTVAPASAVSGVTVTSETAFGTLAV